MDGGGTLVHHGYTVADLDRLACKAAWESPWRFLPVTEREDVARFAIVEHRLTCERPADFWDLVKLGAKAIWAHVEDEGRYRGGTRPVTVSSWDGVAPVLAVLVADGAADPLPGRPDRGGRGARADLAPADPPPSDRAARTGPPATTTSARRHRWTSPTAASCLRSTPPGNSSCGCGTSTRRHRKCGGATAATATAPRPT